MEGEEHRLNLSSSDVNKAVGAIQFLSSLNLPKSEGAPAGGAADTPGPSGLGTGKEMEVLVRDRM